METRKIFLFVVSAIFFLLSDSFAAGRDGSATDNFLVYQPLPISKSAKFLAAPDISGGIPPVLGLENFGGEFLVVHFWATWCIPCRAELPRLDAVTPQLEAEGIKVIAISEDFKGFPLIESFFKKHNLKNLKPYLDFKGSLYKAINVSTLPTTIFINKNGNEIAMVKGVLHWNDSEVLSFIKALL